MGTIGIIGTGNMGSAIAKGLSSATESREILLFDTDTVKMNEAATECGAGTSESACTLLKKSDIVIVAIKPQHLATLFKEISPCSKGHKFISIVAGRRIEGFQKALHSTQVVRLMPNLAATVSASVVGVAVAEGVDDDFRMEALTIAETLGSAVPLPEELISAITGLSGSGIAYVFAFLHAMALGGTQAGIPYPTSLGIAKQTLKGAIEVLDHNEISPNEMLTRVASAGGTTIEGIRALEERGFTAAVMDAVTKAAERADAIEKDSSEPE